MMSEKSGTVHTGYDINRFLVIAATTNGISYTQLCRMFAMLNMPPPMSETTWYFYKARIHAGAKRAANKHLCCGGPVPKKDGPICALWTQLSPWQCSATTRDPPPLWM
eukprot:TRINITY_DN68457_c0_g1_i4.p1 TRINITY_DN68457_c0_g1~~TRINITY_DN68457_c0_g1_i4.p1  ORF type:complete len:108 (+),score=20.97 TRINITY_DN68457_c0_g1_i4:318-641(+)